MASLVEDLKALRRIFEAGKWCQHTLSISGRYCLLGGIHKIADAMDGDFMGRFINMKAAVYSQLPYHPHGNSIGYWNDQPERTVDDVIDLIDRTIAAEESYGKSG